MQGNDIKLSLSVILGSILLVAAIVFVARVFDRPDIVAVDQTVGESRPTQGNSNATTTIVEFSDFQCPSCKAAQPIVDKFMSDYRDQVKLVFRHFPLPQHQNSNAAAYAAEAADHQGKFWEVHDWLFTNQSTWSAVEVSGEYFYDKFGADLGLNKDQFLADYVSNDVRSVVDSDRSAANSLKVNSTPTFFINGKRFSGVTSYDDFVSASGVTPIAPTQTIDVPQESVAPTESSPAQ
ncbi:thioredoxin domain-containing protein [candidate division WWE3 bacterium]|nr:thioredoxin domain-containing protein [candidate division WWE3 bacterium]